MKKYITLLIILTVSVTAKAQLPEFGLHAKLFVNNDSARTVVFGYDPAASDSMVYGKETWFSNEFPGGEQKYPGAQIGDLDFRMTGNYINRPELEDIVGNGGPIDIRKKPALDSFILKYEIDLQVVHGTTNARMEWNPQLIPAKINRITLASYHFPHKFRLDMKSVSSFVFPLKDSGEDLYSSMILTLYYNTTEIEKAAVKSVPGGSPQELTCFPNPMDSRSKLHFMTSADNRIMLSAYDVTGKKVLERLVNAVAGENTVELGTNAFSLHPGVYWVRLSGIQGGQIFEKSGTIIVR